MNSKKISSITCEFLSNYFSRIWLAVKSRQITPLPSKPFLYPSILLVVESNKHFIIEILGHRLAFDTSLHVCRRRIKSTTAHFDQFAEGANNPAMAVNIGDLSLDGIVLCRVDENEKLTSRFPILRGFGQGYRLHQAEGNGSLISFGCKVRACVLKQCFFVNANKGLYRLKMVNFGIVLGKHIDTVTLIDLLKREFPPSTVRGVFEPHDNLAEAMQISGQLQSLYLSPTVHETTIGTFLSTHPLVISAALGTTDQIYGPHLRWVHKPPGVEATAIIPDMVVCRRDGYWDIVDFKTAALDRKQLTKGKHQRRRFIDYVYEGIAQLANYANYFDYPDNCRFAEEKYGIRVNSPNLYLVVGSMENCDTGRVLEALRAHKSVSLIDYDTVIQAYLNAAKKIPE